MNTIGDCLPILCELALRSAACMRRQNSNPVLRSFRFDYEYDYDYKIRHFWRQLIASSRADVIKS